MIPRLPRKLLLDAALLALLMAGFGYAFTGGIIHELLGLGMLGASILHGIWNAPWFFSLFRGHYQGIRVAFLAVNILLLLAALLMMVSGIANSELLFLATGVEYDIVGREIHTASAHWFLLLAAIHLGLHGKWVMSEAGKVSGVWSASSLPRTLPPVLATAIAAYGLHAFLDRSLYARLIGYYSFGSRNPDESVIVFFVQHLAIVGLGSIVAYNVLRIARRHSRQGASFRSTIGQSGRFCGK